MTLLRLLCLLIALANAAAVAQEVSAPPDPVSLSADWWSYFEKAGEGSGSLDGRVTKAVERLRGLEEQLSAEEWVRLSPQVETLAANLKRYGELVATELPTPPPAVAARESYNLADLRALVVDLRKAAVASSSEAQDISALEEAVAREERAQSQRKVAYLALDAADPQRAQYGLDLMLTRLQLELGKRELKFRSARLEALRSKLENLQTLVSAAARRVISTPEAIEQVSARRQQAEKQAADLRARLAKAELARSGVLALAPEEQARAQLQAQRALTIEAEALTQELVAAQAGLSETLLLRAASGNTLDPGPHRGQLRAYEEQLEQARTRLAGSRTETLRNKTSALTRVTTEESAKVAALLRERIDATDATERQLAALDEQLSVSEQFGELLADQLRDAEGSVGYGIQLFKDWIAEGWQGAGELLSASLFEISETPVTTLGLLRMLFIMTVAWWLSKLARRGLLSVAARRESVNQSSVYTLGRILHYAILAVGIMIALSSIGIDLTKFALFASALGVGIGFGLQTLVSNFVAGLIILFEKSLKVGDFVELESGVTGEVKEINMRSTLITTNDNIDIVVPNSEFVNSRVTNWTMRDVYRRIHIAFGVAYGTDKELVKKAALEASAEVDVTLKGHSRRDPQVWFVEFGDSSLNFELVVWLTPDAVKRPGAVQAAYLWAIDDKLRKYEIEVPFPQRDLHLRSAFGITHEEGQALLRARAVGAAAD